MVTKKELKKYLKENITLNEIMDNFNYINDIGDSICNENQINAIREGFKKELDNIINQVTNEIIQKYEIKTLKDFENGLKPLEDASNLFAFTYGADIIGESDAEVYYTEIGFDTVRATAEIEGSIYL